MSGIPLSVIGNYVLFLDVDSAGGQFLREVGDTPEDDGVHDRGSPVPKPMAGTPFRVK